METVKKFFEKLKTDGGLLAKVKDAANNEQIVGIAKKAGFDFSLDDLTKFLDSNKGFSLDALKGGAGDLLGKATSGLSGLFGGK